MGGYDYNFVEPLPDELTCLICMCVAREPWQMDCCGRVFCKDCLEELRKRTRVLPVKCPNCREQGKSFADRRGTRVLISVASDSHAISPRSGDLVPSDHSSGGEKEGSGQ